MSHWPRLTFFTPKFLNHLVSAVSNAVAENVRQTLNLARPSRETHILQEVAACMHVTQVVSDKLFHDTFSKRSGSLRSNDLMAAINTFALAGLLRNDSFAMKACQWAVQCLLPDEVSDPLVKALATSKKPVSPSTLSRLRSRIDAALILSFREKLKSMMAPPGLYLYPMLDASPQGVAWT